MSEVEIELFPAKAGDCVLITFQEIDYRILIDGGFKDTFENSLASSLKKLGAQGKKIDLLVVTHIDNDHIMGIIALLEALERGNLQIEIGEIWYNGYEHLFTGRKKQISPNDEKSVFDEVCKLNVVCETNVRGMDIGYSQGQTLTELLEKRWKQKWNCHYKGNAVYSSTDAVSLSAPYLLAHVLNPGKCELENLEKKWNQFLYIKYLPEEKGDSLRYGTAFERFCSSENNKEYFLKSKKAKRFASGTNDPSVTNKSSIALYLEYTSKKSKRYRLLFLGDAVAEQCLERIPQWDRIKFDCVKLPHHGSDKNITTETIKALYADNVLFSTDGQKHDHPNLDVLLEFARSEKCKRMIFNYDCDEKLKRLREEYSEKEVRVGENGYYRLEL